MGMLLKYFMKATMIIVSFIGMVKFGLSNDLVGGLFFLVLFVLCVVNDFSDFVRWCK